MPPTLRSLLLDPWAIQPDRLDLLVRALVDPARSDRAAALLVESAPAKPYAVADATAIIPVAGVLVPAGAADLRAWGEEATGYDEIRAALSAANADPAVARIRLAIDSPGGAVRGVHQTGDAIAASAKPVAAHIDGLGASAAYWLASQATAITADPHAQIGSIGVYTVAADISGLLAKNGIKLDLISSGGIKGHGADGAITPELRAEIQKRIDAMATDFVAAVAAGRSAAGRVTSTNDARSWATGHVWSAAEAQRMGLIDTVATAAATTQKDRTMSALALIKKHPGHAALIADLAEQGQAVEQIAAAIERADTAAAHAALIAERDAAKAAADQAAATAQTAAAALAAEKARADKAEAELAALKDLADAGKAGARVKPDATEPAARSITRADYEKDPAKFAADLAAGRLTITA